MEVKSIGEAALAQEKGEQPPKCLTKKHNNNNQVKQLIACQGWFSKFGILGDDDDDDVL